MALLCEIIAAKDVRADWYDDAKSIIEQLIEDNISTEVIPNAAGKLPVACDFFPSTIYALEAKRYDGLPAIIRKEVADAVGLFVLKKIDPTTLVSVSSTSSQGKTPTLPVSLDPTSLKMFNQAVMPLDSKAVRIEARSKKKKSPLLDQIDLSASTTGGISDFKGCTFIGTPPPDKPAPTPTESKATAALRECLLPQDDITRELACSAAVLTRDAANGDEKLLAGDLKRLTAALILQEVSKDFTSFQIKDLSVSLTTALGTPAGTADYLANAVCKDPSKEAATTADPTSFEKCTINVKAAGALLLARDVTTLEQALAIASSIASRIADTCKTKMTCSDTVINAINAFIDIAKGGDEVIRDVQSRNYGAAAGAILSVVEAIKCENDEKLGCNPTEQKVYTFLRALAIYSIDSETSPSPSTSAEADFRKASIDLIEAAGGAGIRRRILDNFQFAWVPEFSLRDAWRPGHIGTTQNELLVYASIDLVRGRIFYPGQHFYFGVHGSLLDILGPVMEGATRDRSLQSSVHTTSVFLLGFIVPRVDLEFGFPDLTKNLVVGFGGALRGFRAEGVPGAATYCVVGNDCKPGGIDKGPGLTTNNLEGSIFVKYVP